MNLNKWNCATLSHGANQRNRHFIGDVERVDQHGLVAFKTNGIFDEKSREFVQAGVVHSGVTIPSPLLDATSDPAVMDDEK
jgi:hypothetical protein